MSHRPAPSESDSDPTSTAYGILASHWSSLPAETSLASFVASARAHLLDASEMTTAELAAIDWADLYRDMREGL